MVTQKCEYILGRLQGAAGSWGLSGRVPMRTFRSLMAAAAWPHCIHGPCTVPHPWHRNVCRLHLLTCPNPREQVIGCLEGPSLGCRGCKRVALRNAGLTGSPFMPQLTWPGSCMGKGPEHLSVDTGIAPTQGLSGFWPCCLTCPRHGMLRLLQSYCPH